ncbi:MAG TPA: 2-C-methyl-D-erythritol 2,4-cyclodiphosphate synthase [Opitutales bacterium]|jgi:2-C-methyl-D-erythritol 2,4-cyclodiphosphate synthase|nr:2-C-methyl-D-erythritol 2,4-cyclodiphosphate synthase [Opitutales bacterium]
MPSPFRVGLGYDIHRLVPGRKLVLGGVEIPSDLGLDGHSDADALTHALADAVLGALALPDIGHFFPNTDPQCRGMDSQDILRRTVEEAKKRGYRVGNVDIAVLAEKPKLSPHISAMKARLAQTLGVSVEDVGVKATTNEGCDTIGAGQAIAAHAVVLLVKAE